MRLLLVLWTVAVLLRVVGAVLPAAGVWEGGSASTSVVDGLTMEPGRLLAGTAAGLYQSTDEGASWTSISEVGSSQITAVVAGEGRAYAAGPDSWWERAGGEWMRMGSASKSETRKLAIVSGRLLAATEEGLFVRRLDSSGPWRRLWPQEGAGPAAAFTVLASAERLWIGTGDGVVEGALDGNSWRGIGPRGARVLGLSAGGEWLHAAVGSPGGGLMRTRIGGSDWQKADVASDDAATVLADPSDPSRVYAGLSGLADTRYIAGVIASEDAGATWAPVRSRLLNSAAPALVLDPASSTLYAGTNGGGTFRYRFPSVVHRVFDVVAPALELVEPALLGMLALALVLRTRAPVARGSSSRFHDLRQ